MQLRFVLKNKDLKSKVRRINLKLILPNQLAWILDELFRILCGHYQPMQLYLRVSFSLPTLASFFLICTSDIVGMGYRPHFMPRPVYMSVHLCTYIMICLCMCWYTLVSVKVICLSCRYLDCYLLVWHYYLGSILVFPFRFQNLNTICIKTSNKST